MPYNSHSMIISMNSDFPYQMEISFNVRTDIIWQSMGLSGPNGPIFWAAYNQTTYYTPSAGTFTYNAAIRGDSTSNGYVNQSSTVTLSVPEQEEDVYRYDETYINSSDATVEFQFAVFDSNGNIIASRDYTVEDGEMIEFDIQQYGPFDVGIRGLGTDGETNINIWNKDSGEKSAIQNPSINANLPSPVPAVAGGGGGSSGGVVEIEQPEQLPNDPNAQPNAPTVDSDGWYTGRYDYAQLSKLDSIEKLAQQRNDLLANLAPDQGEGEGQDPSDEVDPSIEILEEIRDIEKARDEEEGIFARLLGILDFIDEPEEEVNSKVSEASAIATSAQSSIQTQLSSEMSSLQIGDRGAAGGSISGIFPQVEVPILGTIDFDPFNKFSWLEPFGIFLRNLLVWCSSVAFLFFFYRDFRTNLIQVFATPVQTSSGGGATGIVAIIKQIGVSTIFVSVVVTAVVVLVSVVNTETQSFVSFAATSGDIFSGAPAAVSTGFSLLMFFIPVDHLLTIFIFQVTSNIWLVPLYLGVQTLIRLVTI